MKHGEEEEEEEVELFAYDPDSFVLFLLLQKVFFFAVIGGGWNQPAPYITGIVLFVPWCLLPTQACGTQGMGMYEQKNGGLGHV